MSTRLSIITTRTGDQGETGLGDGTRLPKDDPRVAAIGDVDELNSTIGLLRAEILPADVDALFAGVQHDLFDVGAELCIPGHFVLNVEHVAKLEQALTHYNAELPSLQEFILPGGVRSAALAHVARTVCRRAERAVIHMDRAAGPHQQSSVHVRLYLNRLSDLCFVLARTLNRTAGQPDILWSRAGD
jgi:cob(I)alamin adenosyltransferase